MNSKKLKINFNKLPKFLKQKKKTKKKKNYFNAKLL